MTPVHSACHDEWPSTTEPSNGGGTGERCSKRPRHPLFVLSRGKRCGFPHRPPRRSMSLNGLRLEDRIRQLVTVDLAGNVLGIQPFDLVGEDAAFVADTAAGEVDLALARVTIEGGRLNKCVGSGRHRWILSGLGASPGGSRRGGIGHRSSTRMMVRTRTVRKGSLGSSAPADRSRL